MNWKVSCNIMTHSCHHQKERDCWISSFDDDKLWVMIIQEIYYILISKLCLTGFILKTSGIINIQTSQHTWCMSRHTKQKSQRQVDTHAGSVDTFRENIKDMSTHIYHVPTQLKGYVENRSTHKLCVST